MDPIRRAWIVLGTVVAAAFLVLGFFGREVYRQAPPIPDRVVTASGRAPRSSRRRNSARGSRSSSEPR